MRPILIAITISLLSTNWSQAETLVQLRNRVNTWLTNHVGGANGLVSKQNAYFVANGKYWQGLLSFSSIPNRTASTVADAPADRLALHPTDQASSWTNFVPTWSGELFAAAAQVDTYDGPIGKGWSLTVWVRYEGVTYQRKKCFGPDVSDDFDWRVWEDEQ